MNTSAPFRRFDAPTILIHGGGSRRKLPDVVRELGGTRILLVTDARVVQLGLAAETVRDLEAAGFNVAVFSDVQADPTDINIAAGVAALNAQRADLVIALGGGSPIDAGKVIAVRPTNP